ncbi:hypothetical protein CK203_087240 [Vitis vinifera]|uniref:Retrotransposon Copia-like N-terminal domain-containing protein n=1 Tax=Vitis vinifera TaxID=29760 RepID=A0A438BM12_VITVI|nr:hypothetical protein CK203_087240 [Vitis vinifera]
MDQFLSQTQEARLYQLTIRLPVLKRNNTGANSDGCGDCGSRVMGWNGGNGGKKNGVVCMVMISAINDRYGEKMAFGMATNSSSSTSDIIISSSSSSHQMETSHLPITAHKLNGQNYLQWSQSILMFIRGKEKDDYITGASVAPETTTSTYKKWIAENNMVMSWLVNSMTADIGENFLSFDTAKEIWDTAKETFSNKENTSEIIQIEGILHDLRQGNLTKAGTLKRNLLEDSWKASRLEATSTTWKEGRDNHVATDEQSPQPEASPFNKEQMEMLQKLLSPLLSIQSQTGSSSN